MVRGAALHENGIAPDAVQLGDAFPPANDAEAVFAMQSDAGFIFGEDGCLQGPEAAGGECRNECIEQGGADALAVKTRGNVYADLGDA